MQDIVRSASGPTQLGKAVYRLGTRRARVTLGMQGMCRQAASRNARANVVAPGALAKSVLVVKKRWLDKILAGQKTWEIRQGPTAKRGWIHFAQSGSTGKLMGRARLVGCRLLRRSSFEQNVSHHCVDSWDDVTYKTPYAWVLEDAERFERPFDYNHKRGAVIFCGC